MNKVDPILWKFVEPHFDAVADPAHLEAGREMLRVDLQSGIEAEQLSFWICTGMILLLFVGAFVLVLLNLNQPKLIAGVFGVTGVSMTALIRQMTLLWREKARMTLIKQLADSLPAKDLKTIILALLNNQK